MSTNTLIAGAGTQKLYLLSAQFTTTVKLSEDVSGINTSIFDVGWDGVDTFWCGYATADKLYRQSGMFSATLKDSEDVTTVDTVPAGISADDDNTLWIGQEARKLYKTSDKFTSTLKDSESVSGIDSVPTGNTWDGTNTPWCGWGDDKLYLTSGQFTSTIKRSQSINVSAAISGMGWDGINTPWCASTSDRAYLQSGQFTSTIKFSLLIQSVDTGPSGISTDDYDSRVSGLLRGVTDTLTITDQFDETIIRAPRPSSAFNHDLEISDGVLPIFNGVIQVLDPLTITDEAAGALNSINIFDYLEIVDNFNLTSEYTNVVIDTLTISDSIELTLNSYTITDNLIIWDYVDIDPGTGVLERERLAINVLDISDEVVLATGYAFKITDELTITDEFISTLPISPISITDTLDILDSTGGIFQYNLEIIENEVIFIDDENLIEYIIQDWVERHYIAQRVSITHLTIQQIVQVSHEKDSATADTADNTLTITDEATVGRNLTNSLSISDAVQVTQGQLALDALDLSDAFVVTKESNLVPSDTLTISITVEYTHIQSYTHREYSPFIGDTTDSDAPTPPDEAEPVLTSYPNVRLSYPTTSPTHILTLRGPELGNLDQQHYTRIQRETRGGTLVVFSATDWPEREQLNLQFLGLTEAESQEVLTFLSVSLGKQIRLRDWEGRVWTVITLSPGSPIIRQGDCKNSVSLDFESATVA